MAGYGNPDSERDNVERPSHARTSVGVPAQQQMHRVRTGILRHSALDVHVRLWTLNIVGEQYLAYNEEATGSVSKDCEMYEVSPVCH